MIIIIMGVCGCGKSTIGKMLAKRLQCGFSDADVFHSKANIDKMRAGIPLQDEDRWSWLASIRTTIDDFQKRGESHVIACSALRQAYRDVLSPNGDVTFVYMKGSKDIIRSRLEARQGHYMNPALLNSQFATLEEPKNALTINIEATPEMIVDYIQAKLPTTIASVTSVSK